MRSPLGVGDLGITRVNVQWLLLHEHVFRGQAIFVLMSL